MAIFNRPKKQPTQDEFAATVERTMRKVAGWRVAAYDKEEFRPTLSRDGEENTVMNLRNLYAEYCNAPPSNRAALLQRTCIGLAQQVEAPNEFEDAKPDLFPTIRSKASLEVMRLDRKLEGECEDDIPWIPVSEHLAACLVYDLPNTMQFVTEKRLDEWGVSLYEAMEIAKRNLEQIEFAVGAIDGRLYLFAAGDAYDASRMVLLDAVRSLKVTGRPVALPVSRDSLMVAGSDDVEALGMMADLAEKKEDEPRSLCPIPHQLVGDEWEAWLPPPDHPHHDRFRMLQLKFLHANYAEQKSFLTSCRSAPARTFSWPVFRPSNATARCSATAFGRRAS